MASGKSTIRRLLTTVLSTDTNTLISQGDIEVSSFGILGVVGLVKENGACDGLDSSFGRIKKDGGLKSVDYSIKNHEITILEGSQTSGEWVKPLMEMCKLNHCKFTMILMDVPLWVNYNRLLKRILERGGSESDMTDKRLESVRSKSRQFATIYDKSEIYPEINRHKLNTMNKTDEEKIVEVLVAAGIM